MDSWRYEDDDEADEYEVEDDDLFRQDLEALKRACMLTGGGDEYEAAAPDRVAESGNESEEIDDMEFLRSIQKKLCLPIDVSARTSDGSSDLDEDDFETLRAIECRFAKYNDDEAKKKVSSSLQHGSDSVRVKLLTNGDASLQSVIGSSNAVSTPLTLESADVFGLEDHSMSARGHGPEGDELPSSSVVPLTKSHFSDSVRVFIEAVKKNRSCQQFIRSKLTQIETMLSENKELINRAKCLVDLQIACKKQATRFLRQESGARVRENSHVPFFRKVLSKFPSALKRRPWSGMERENLAKGVKQQIQDGSEEDFTQPNLLDTAVAEISNLNISPEHIKSFLPQVDWNRLASMYLKDRSGAECRARWLNNEDPLINHNPWSKSDDKQLLFIVQQGGPYNWIHVAELLGINRTASQCLSRYQRSLNVNILRGDWTEEEDVQLRAAVEVCGENNWQLVASHLEGRTGVQCSNRWRKCLHPSKERFGRWTVEEDKRLKIAVTLFGRRAWKKICGFIPGRTQVQCRERWIHSLDPSLRLDVWTDEEDMKLKAAIAECGKKWAKVAARIPGRTNGQCRRRWKVLFPDEVSLAQKAQKIKKSALISNFVYRSKDRPALGPDDFLPVQGDAETVDAKNENVGKSKKRIPDHVTFPESSLIGTVFSRSSSDLNATGFNAPASLEDGCIQLEDNTCFEKGENVGLSDSHNLEGEQLEAVICEGIKSNGVQKQLNGEPAALVKHSGFLEHGKKNACSLPRARRASRRNVNYRDLVSGKFDLCIQLEDNTCAEKNVGLPDSHNLEGEGLEAVLCEGIGSNGLQKQLIGEPAVVKDSGFLEHGKENGGSLLRAKRASRRNVNYREMVNGDFDLCIQMEDNTCAEKGENVGMLDSHNLEGAQSEAVLCEGIESCGVQKQLNGEPAFVKDAGFLEHGKENGGSLPRARRTSRKNVKYRRTSRKNVKYKDMVTAKFDLRIQLEDNRCAEKGENVGLLDSHDLEGAQLEAVLCEGIEPNGVQKQLNAEPAIVKDSGFLEHGQESGGSLPRARRASRRNVNYSDMVSGNFDFFGGR
ncbi:Myb-like protein L [Nymphaea thermarum]|nr:Myb-like protein L [Nymphaea thermarum]